MAYDPKDPEDKKIVQGLIDAALAQQTEEHEADVAGLKKKNSDLIRDLKKAREGQEGADPEEVSRLEAQLAENNKTIKTLNKELKEAKTAYEETAKALETESSFGQKLLVDGGLTEALTKAKVAPELLPAVKALLAPQVIIKTEGESRKAYVGDKELGSFVNEWSQGDQGKHFVSANLGSGTNAPGGSRGNPGAKTMTRAAYEQLQQSNSGAAATFFKDGGTLTDD